MFHSCIKHWNSNSYELNSLLYFRGNFKGVPPYSLGAPCASCPDDCQDNLCSKCISVFGCKIFLNDDVWGHSLHSRMFLLYHTYCFIDFQLSLLANPCPYINTYTNCDALIEEATCENSIVSEGCPASCLCEDKIIPIARKWNFLWLYYMKYSHILIVVASLSYNVKHTYSNFFLFLFFLCGIPQIWLKIKGTVLS